MRRRADSQVQVARLPAARALLALAGDADARAFAHAGRNPHVDGARLAVVLNGEATRRALVDVLERELELLLEVASGACARRPRAAAARARPLLTHAPAEEGLEEIGERLLAPEHLGHFVLRHRAIAAAGSA